MSLKGDWAKGYSRLGAAQFGLGELETARDTYKRGLEVDGSNAQLRQGLQDVEAAIAAKQSREDNPLAKIFSDPGLMGKLATNPKTRAFLGQPDFMQMMAAVQRDPSNINAYLQDPRMMQVMGVAMGIDMDMADPAGEKDTATTASPPPPPAEPEEPPPAPEPLDPEAAAAKEKKESAQQAKQRGNEAYKAKRFEEAIAAYNEAIALDDSDISFITDRKSVV